jgi:hypothetical protein
VSPILLKVSPPLPGLSSTHFGASSHVMTPNGEINIALLYERVPKIRKKGADG